MRRSRLTALGAVAGVTAIAGGALLWIHKRGERLARSLRKASGDWPVQEMDRGFGPIFFRTYRIDIPGTRLTPGALMRTVQADPDAFSPAGIARFEKTRGADDSLGKGDEFYIHIRAPWDGPVRVLERSDTSFDLGTLEGHMEAGTIRFRSIARPEGGLRFEIVSCARSVDRAVHTLYDILRAAKGAQELMWSTFCERVAAAAVEADKGGGEPGADAPEDVVVRTFQARYEDPLEPGGSPEQGIDQSLLTDLAERTLNFEPADDGAPPGDWNHDDDEVDLIREPAGPPLDGGSWSHACEFVRAYQFPNPRRVVGRFDPDAPLKGRTMLLQARFLGLAFPFGVRVSRIIDETRTSDDGPVRVWGYSYRTLEEHFERGQITFLVGKELDSGRVFFRIHSYSASAPIANPLYRLGFKLLGRRLQREFALNALERTREYVVERLVREACLKGDGRATKLLLGDPISAAEGEPLA